MKWTRVVLALTVLGMAACSSPTGPRLPQPDEGSKDPPPDQPGLVALVAPAPAPVVMV